MSKTMHLVKFKRILPSFTTKCRFLSALPSEEYTETPEYPQILKLDRNSKKERTLLKWSEQIKKLNTVEEKQMKLNMPKFYGWKSIMLDDQLIPYDSMRFIQHCVRTHFKEVDRLPEFYNNVNVDSLLTDVKSSIEDVIAIELEGFKRNHEINKIDLDKAIQEELISSSIVEQINRMIINQTSNLQHLLNSQIDFNPRHEAFWFVGGLPPTDFARKSRENVKWMKEFANESLDRAVQYIGKPNLAVRTELPLQPLVSESEADNPDFEVPFFELDPRVVGYNSTYRHGTNIPGFWPGDPYEFGLLSYQKRSHIQRRSPTFGEADNLEAIHSQAMLSSFSWLLSQASYQGFTNYNDLTYPLVTQTVVTNGKEWNFYAYQLNTVVMYSDFINTNSKRNICWGTRSQKLFESVDQNGKLIGFNDEVLKNLLRFYANAPQERMGVDLKPYLNKNEKYIAEIQDDDKRQWLEREYKHMMSNRPRHRLGYETYHWEKIYKIDHQTRVMEPRRRHFEIGLNPMARTYDQKKPKYIPKALRPDGPKSKPSHYKMYYP